MLPRTGVRSRIWERIKQLFSARIRIVKEQCSLKKQAENQSLNQNAAFILLHEKPEPQAFQNIGGLNKDFSSSLFPTFVVVVVTKGIALQKKESGASF